MSDSKEPVLIVCSGSGELQIDFTLLHDANIALFRAAEEDPTKLIEPFGCNRVAFGVCVSHSYAGCFVEV